MERHDWLLLVLAAADGKPLSPVQLQKALFLVGYGLSDVVGPDFYSFQPYDYGPFDGAIYQDALDQEREGLVAVRPHSVTDREYALTAAGLAQARALEGQVTADAVRYCRVTVQWVQRQTFGGLVRAIYEQFPEYAERSVLPGVRVPARATRRRPRRRRSASAAVLTGAARLLDFGTTLRTRPVRRRTGQPGRRAPTDGAALRSDWEAVGGDLQAAIYEFAATQARPAARGEA